MTTAAGPRGAATTGALDLVAHRARILHQEWGQVSNGVLFREQYTIRDLTPRVLTPRASSVASGAEEAREERVGGRAGAALLDRDAREGLLDVAAAAGPCGLLALRAANGMTHNYMSIWK